MANLLTNTTIIAINKHDYINGLANLTNKIDKLEFINNFQQKFNILQNIDANKYFIYLHEHKSEFVVTFEQLVKYGIITKCQSISTLETAFRSLDFKASIDYKINISIINPLRNNIDILLTPLSFKKLLYRARMFDNKVSMYDTYNYYNMLDEIYSYYTDYLTLWSQKHICTNNISQIKRNINIDLPYYKNEIDLHCYETLNDCTMSNIDSNNRFTKSKSQVLPSISTLLKKY